MAEHRVNFIRLSFLRHTGTRTENDGARTRVKQSRKTFTDFELSLFTEEVGEKGGADDEHPSSWFGEALADATGGVTDGIGAVRERFPSLNTSPARNFAGYISDLVLDNLSQISDPYPNKTGRCSRMTIADHDTEPYLPEVRRNGIRT